MQFYETEDAYKKEFQAEIGDVNEELTGYINEQFDQLEQLIGGISGDNYWQVFPKILGIDAKLSLVTELVRFDEISPSEILRLVENDYRTYVKELCGYGLKTETNPSIIFNVV